MKDRIRIGELLAGAGAIGLALLLAFGKWFEITASISEPIGISASQRFGSDKMGWFLLLLMAAAAAAGLVYLFRILTAPTTARIMAQGPVAFTFALLALIVGLIRLLLFTPDLPAPARVAAQVANDLVGLELETGLTTAGWLGLACLLALTVGSWISIADERDDTPWARAQTEALLADVPVRPAPAHTDTEPASDAGVVADDAVGTDPKTTGGSPA